MSDLQLRWILGVVVIAGVSGCGGDVPSEVATGSGEGVASSLSAPDGGDAASVTSSSPDSAVCASISAWQSDVDTFYQSLGQTDVQGYLGPVDGESAVKYEALTLRWLTELDKMPLEDLEQPLHELALAYGRLESNPVDFIPGEPPSFVTGSPTERSRTENAAAISALGGEVVSLIFDTCDAEIPEL